MVLFLGANNLFAQEQDVYKGLWGRLEVEPGISLNSFPNELKGIKGNGIFTYGYAFTLGYHFNKWSVGLGGNISAHVTPRRFGNIATFIEGSYRPFDGELAPLAFNLRAGLPVAYCDEYKVKMTSSASVSWHFLRKKLWNMIGGEVSAGIEYMPYRYNHITYVYNNNIPYGYDAERIEKPYDLNKVNLFVRLAITFN